MIITARSVRLPHIGHRHAAYDGQAHLEDEDGDHDRQRRGQARDEDVRNRFVGGPAASPVEGGHLGHEEPKLFPYRSVQAQLFADRFDLRRRRLQAAEDFSGVAAEVLEQEEDQEDDTREGGDHLEDPSCEVGKHRVFAVSRVGHRSLLG
jgi:hypothetical protein